MKALKYTREIIITVLLITVALLFFFRGCGGKEAIEQNRILTQRTDSLERAIKARDERMSVMKQDYNKDTAAARREAQSAVNDVKAVKKELYASQQTIYRLSAKLDKGKTDTSDTFVKVNPSFVEDCDSIKLVALNQQTQIDDYTSEAQEAEKLLKYETKLRDDQIERERKYSDSVNQALTVQRAIAREAIALSKPRGRFLAGAGVIGNQAQPVSGASVKFAYLTKGGKMYQVSPQILQGELYYEGSVLITLFK